MFCKNIFTYSCLKFRTPTHTKKITNNRLELDPSAEKIVYFAYSLSGKVHNKPLNLITLNLLCSINRGFFRNTFCYKNNYFSLLARFIIFNTGFIIDFIVKITLKDKTYKWIT